MFKLILIVLILYIVFSQQKSTTKTTQRANDPTLNPYEVLGVSSSSTEEEIRTAFREQSKKNHPDLVSHMSKDFQKLAEEKVRLINWAYQEIKRLKGF